MPARYEVNAWVRFVGVITGLLARLGVGNITVLTTTGRRSGQRRPVPVSPITDGDAAYIVSPYGDVSWVQNVRADPVVELRRGLSKRQVRLREVTGEAEGIVRRYYEREPFARRFMDVPGEATTADFATVSGRFPVFRVE